MSVRLFALLLENLYGSKTRDTDRRSDVDLGGNGGGEGRKALRREDPWVGQGRRAQT